MKLVNVIRLINNFCHPATMIVGENSKSDKVDINVMGTPEYLIKSFADSDIDVVITDICFVGNEGGNEIPYPRFSCIAISVAYSHNYKHSESIVLLEDTSIIDTKIENNSCSWEFELYEILEIFRNVNNRVKLRGFNENNPSEFVDFVFGDFNSLIEFTQTYDFTKWHMNNIIPYTDYDSCSGMEYITLCCFIIKN